MILIKKLSEYNDRGCAFLRHILYHYKVSDYLVFKDTFVEHVFFEEVTFYVCLCRNVACAYTNVSVTSDLGDAGGNHVFCMYHLHIHRRSNIVLFHNSSRPTPEPLPLGGRAAGA